MQLSDKIKKRLRSLPDKPGVYFMRDKFGKIIYVGKASSLKNRVRHYFQQATLRSAPPKLRGLIKSIADFEFLVVRSDADAVATESRLIKEYRPHYNAIAKDDKRYLLLRVNLNEAFPRFETCRIRKNDAYTYFGPYIRPGAARAAQSYVEKTFGLRSCRPRIPTEEHYRHCNNDVIRYCTAPCVGRIVSAAYHERVEQAMAFLRGERRDLLNSMKEEMEQAAADMDFERAAELRDTLSALWSSIRERSKGVKDLELKKAEARRGAEELKDILRLKRPARHIECFDNSNISGTHAVSAMVCAIDGMPDPRRYRHFRIRTVNGIDDPAMMGEAVGRRYARLQREGKPMPDLILIDGGVTQLGAAREALQELGLSDIPTAGLAKRFEEIHTETSLTAPPIRLPEDSNALKVLQRIRDEAHRFSLSYHRKLRAARIRDSVLDEIEGIGEKRKQLLISTFGSVRRLSRASEEEIASVQGIGPVMARAIKEQLERALG